MKVKRKRSAFAVWEGGGGYAAVRGKYAAVRGGVRPNALHPPNATGELSVLTVDVLRLHDLLRHVFYREN